MCHVLCGGQGDRWGTPIPSLPIPIFISWWSISFHPWIACRLRPTLGHVALLQLMLTAMIASVWLGGSSRFRCSLFPEIDLVWLWRRWRFGVTRRRSQQLHWTSTSPPTINPKDDHQLHAHLDKQRHMHPLPNWVLLIFQHKFVHWHWYYLISPKRWLPTEVKNWPHRVLYSHRLKQYAGTTYDDVVSE